jgi:hypothetical protein
MRKLMLVKEMLTALSERLCEDFVIGACHRNQHSDTKAMGCIPLPSRLCPPPQSNACTMATASKVATVCVMNPDQTEALSLCIC